MFKSIKTLLLRVGILVSAIVIAYGGWRWGSGVFPRAEALLGIDRPEETAPDPTPLIAEETRARLEAFVQGNDEEIRLAGVEVTSLLRHAVPGALPSGTLEPLVLFRGDRMEVHALIVPAAIPELPDLGPAFGILPDTVPVEIGGTLMPFGDSGSVLMLSRMQAKGIPIPRRIFEDVLGALGRMDVAGLPPEGIRIPVPDGARGAYVEDGMLVLTRR